MSCRSCRPIVVIGETLDVDAYHECAGSGCSTLVTIHIPERPTKATNPTAPVALKILYQIFPQISSQSYWPIAITLPSCVVQRPNLPAPTPPPQSLTPCLGSQRVPLSRSRPPEAELPALRFPEAICRRSPASRRTCPLSIR
jgi:hypothetical protein